MVCTCDASLFDVADGGIAFIDDATQQSSAKPTKSGNVELVRKNQFLSFGVKDDDACVFLVRVLKRSAPLHRG